MDTVAIATVATKTARVRWSTSWAVQVYDIDCLFWKWEGSGIAHLKELMKVQHFNIFFATHAFGQEKKKKNDFDEIGTSSKTMTRKT